ncbi:MAG: hypothetical protein A3G32_03895 [Deltaproteobacteria bacterium RIFCSPLOWO2_12_FULL_40_28]|nr:MAG: hypothetical protein A3C45_05980 [Deltaproteobacteria bacterium RIFCSPHIGHO2_02_FULL_40_28]OGQ20464.1 MAG: hypothetical protein A3E27_01775 [Deltaproteobacteria bacterium RIFCSPHIGHO2_12_FULL_40_32]OGQ41094.1 MAG: hypothetical protein A3I69_08640 [Deltaproteobacteria bacterium RIFCSPLOWO2_02_FULL_40_36]OGQ55074.1 MAG: hypothetical protein A3G32_03895 [Deltaproteobacteria bacterium RIFCSPLOWO2_12_FULL_40_28]
MATRITPFISGGIDVFTTGKDSEGAYVGVQENVGVHATMGDGQGVDVYVEGSLQFGQTKQEIAHYSKPAVWAGTDANGNTVDQTDPFGNAASGENINNKDTKTAQLFRYGAEIGAGAEIYIHNGEKVAVTLPVGAYLEGGFLRSANITNPGVAAFSSSLDGSQQTNSYFGFGGKVGPHFIFKDAIKTGKGKGAMDIDVGFYGKVGGRSYRFKKDASQITKSQFGMVYGGGLSFGMSYHTIADDTGTGAVAGTNSQVGEWNTWLDTHFSQLKQADFPGERSDIRATEMWVPLHNDPADPKKITDWAKKVVIQVNVPTRDGSGKEWVIAMDGFSIANPAAPYTDPRNTLEVRDLEEILGALGIMATDTVTSTATSTGVASAQVTEKLAVIQSNMKNVSFEFGKDVLTADSQRVLTEVATTLKSSELAPYFIVIEGHTDSKGDDAYNSALSQRRAAAVRTFLISKGIPDTRIKSEGFGETRPVVTNNTQEGRAQNRRVELRLTNADGSLISTTPTSGTTTGGVAGSSTSSTATTRPAIPVEWNKAVRYRTVATEASTKSGTDTHITFNGPNGSWGTRTDDAIPATGIKDEVFAVATSVGGASSTPVNRSRGYYKELIHQGKGSLETKVGQLEGNASSAERQKASGQTPAAITRANSNLPEVQSTLATVETLLVDASADAAGDFGFYSGGKDAYVAKINDLKGRLTAAQTKLQGIIGSTVTTGAGTSGSTRVGGGTAGTSSSATTTSYTFINFSKNQASGTASIVYTGTPVTADQIKIVGPSGEKSASDVTVSGNTITMKYSGIADGGSASYTVSNRGTGTVMGTFTVTNSNTRASSTAFSITVPSGEQANPAGSVSLTVKNAPVGGIKIDGGAVQLAAGGNGTITFGYSGITAGTFKTFTVTNAAGANIGTFTIKMKAAGAPPPPPPGDGEGTPSGGSGLPDVAN